MGNIETVKQAIAKADTIEQFDSTKSDPTQVQPHLQTLRKVCEIQYRRDSITPLSGQHPLRTIDQRGIISQL